MERHQFSTKKKIDRYLFFLFFFLTLQQPHMSFRQLLKGISARKYSTKKAIFLNEQQLQALGQVTER